MNPRLRNLVSYSEESSSAGGLADTSYETSVAGTAIRLNVEHRTSNIERPISMALRFIHFKAVSAYDELFGRELLFEKLRVERLGRDESQWIDSLLAFVANLAK